MVFRLLGDMWHDELPSGGEKWGRSCLWLCIKTTKPKGDKKDKRKKDSKSLWPSVQ